jgi:hypothetical protein
VKDKLSGQRRDAELWDSISLLVSVTIVVQLWFHRKEDLVCVYIIYHILLWDYVSVVLFASAVIGLSC